MTATKFSFDTVFDTEGQVLRESNRVVEKKTFSAEEVKVIREEAYQDGSRCAEAQAAQAIALAIGETTHAMLRILEVLDDEMEKLRGEAIDVALKGAEKIAGAALDAFPTVEIERLILECAEGLPGEARLVVRVSPDAADALRTRVETLAAEKGYAGRVIVVSESDMSGSDARIEWSQGGLERDVAALAADIARRVHEALAANAAHRRHGDASQ